MASHASYQNILIFACLLLTYMKAITLPSRFKNVYYGLRHGQSESNVEGIISSDLLIGSTTHGLTSLGIQQSMDSATQVVDQIGLENLSNTYFYSSIFLRARQTTEHCISALNSIIYKPKHSPLEFLNLHSYKLRIELRERNFGAYDQKPLPLYNDVWTRDWEDPDNTHAEVESVNQVIKRTSTLIDELEHAHQGKYIVLVSHADTLQILQTFLCQADQRKFSQYRFKNGELRNMAALPEPNPIKSEA